MLRLFKQKEIHQPDGIEIKQSPLHGRGVFACKSFKPGAVIETAPVILLQQSDKDFLEATSLFRFYFLVNDNNTPVVLGLGYSSLYNHTAKANAVYTISLKERVLIIKACKPILQGDEITLNYNGSADDETAVYFEPE